MVAARSSASAELLPSPWIASATSRQRCWPKLSPVPGSSARERPGARLPGEPRDVRDELAGDCAVRGVDRGGGEGERVAVEVQDRAVGPLDVAIPDRDLQRVRRLRARPGAPSAPRRAPGPTVGGTFQ